MDQSTTSSEVSTRAPSAEEVTAYLTSHAPLPRQRWRFAMLLLVGIVIGMMLVSGPSLVGLITPWVVILGFLIWAQMKRRQVQRVQSGVQSVRELTVLRHSEEATNLAWRLLPDVRRYVDMHVQTVMLLAANYMANRHYEPALAAQEYLLKHVPGDHPLGLMIRLQRVVGLLHEDRLLDADDELRQLDRAPLDPLAKAMRRVARLFQQIKTNHQQDAVDDIESGDLQAEMRPAGTDAGMGYALAACVYQAIGENDAATTWWQRATLLMPPTVIVRDVRELQSLLMLTPAATLADMMAKDQP